MNNDRFKPLLALLALVFLAAACGSDNQTEVSGTATEPETAESSVPANVTELSADQLTVDHGCGFGFAKGSADQDLALIVTFTGDYTPEGPDLSEPITWPASEWTGEVQTGTDLFADWCNDAIEEDAPVPAVAETWTIVEGTLTIQSDEPNADLRDVTGELSDVVLESANGDRIEFGTIQVANPLWGFFAG